MLVTFRCDASDGVKSFNIKPAVVSAEFQFGGGEAVKLVTSDLRLF